MIPFPFIREVRRLSRDRVDGVEAAWHRVDAIVEAARSREGVIDAEHRRSVTKKSLNPSLRFCECGFGAPNK